MISFFAPSTYWKSIGVSFKMFGVGHIFIIALMAAAIVLLFIFRKRIAHKNIKTILKASTFVWAALEAFKVIFFFSTSGDSYQALREVLPLYLCSLFVYALPLAAFGRGLAKQVGEYTICVLCLISGLLTTINCPVLNSYPFWSFYSLHSLLYHAAMTATGVLMIVSGYVKVEMKKFYYPLIAVCILSVPAIIMNNVVNTDYMLMNTAVGTPVLDIIAEKIGQVPQIFLMFFIYSLLSFLMSLLAVRISQINKIANVIESEPS